MEQSMLFQPFIGMLQRLLFKLGTALADLLKNISQVPVKMLRWILFTFSICYCLPESAVKQQYFLSGKGSVYFPDIGGRRHP